MLKFVNLHGHTGQSVYDAIGSPEDYAEWMLQNAGENSAAFAVTEHGNMNSIGSIVATQKKYDKSGAPVKIIYGVEAYYLPSVENWKLIKAKSDADKKDKKKSKSENDTSLVIEDSTESKGKYFDPIIRRNHLVLCATNSIGLKNLFRIVSRSYREDGYFYRKPRVDLKLLAEFNEGIIASTACLAGVPSWCSLQEDDSDKVFSLYDKELLPLMELFGKDRFFLELQFNRIPEQKLVNKDILEYSKRTGYNMIATADCHYPHPQMFRDREIYRLLGYQMQKKDIDMSIVDKDISEMDCELYLKNGDQIFDAYKESFADVCPDEELIKQLIERTYHIAHDLIEKTSPDDAIKLPDTFVPTTQVKTPMDQLKKLCLEGLKGLGLSGADYIERTRHELKVIKDLGVEEYFLAKKEILDTLKEHMLLGPGRGSGAGSLVNYLLGITLVDPLKHGLLFERFLSPSRAEMPDIDSDVAQKDLALGILKDHFGAENVLAISNYNRLQLRSLVKDISRLYDIPFQEVNNVTKTMEKEAKDKIMEEVGYDQKLYEFTFEKAKQYSPTLREFLDNHPEVGERIENLYREVKSIGKHAGGVLIIPNAESCLPIIRIRGEDQSPITEGITAKHLKYFGLVKFDILGLATLRIIERAIEVTLRQSNGGVKPGISEVWDFYNTHLHPSVIDTEDQEIFKKVYRVGRFPSIFQFEKKAVQSFCKHAGPTSVMDISAITALWRPGPLKGQADKGYLNAAYKPTIQDEHPIIQEVLSETRGLLLYQEQFMMLAHKLADFTMAEADRLRKLLVQPETSLASEMKEERLKIGEKFIKGCIDKGLKKERAERLWNDEILGFISYGFNKSHSVCYAYNSYACAWLYTYHEEAWMKACLECDPDPEKTINVARDLGYDVTKVDILLSEAVDWRVENNTCYPCLTSLKGIGTTAADELVALRGETFGGIVDFLVDTSQDVPAWRWSKFNKKAMDALIRVEGLGSLDQVGPGKMFSSYAHMHRTIIENWNEIKKKKNLKRVHECIQELADAAETKDWSTPEKIAMQKELVGFYDKGLVLAKLHDTFKEFEIESVDEVEDEREKINVWGLVEKRTSRETKNGKKYLIVSVSGKSTITYDFKVWTLTKGSTIWDEGNVVVFSLDYDRDWGYSLNRSSKALVINK